MTTNSPRPSALHVSRRRALVLAGSALCLPSIVTTRAHASAWRPTKNVRLVVPFAAGGANDIIARVLGERLSAMWGHQVVVENRSGAGANIGAAEIARSEPDGHHLLITSSAIAVNKFLFEKLPFDPVADFAPVSLVAIIPNAMVVPKTSPAHNVAEFIAMAKAKPGSLNFGSAGIGSSLHLIGELFKRLAGVDMKHVPYRGAAAAMSDLIGGRIDLMFDTVTVSLNHVREGTIRAIGVSTRERVPTLPDIQPIGDTVAGFDVGSWFALFLPSKTPRNVVEAVSEDVRTALTTTAVAEKLAGLGARIIASTPDQLGSHVSSEMDRWGVIIREAGIKAQDG
ncbi:tripartite tricarboxylate transporter family receptor [Variibacter gotjawalensis]|uniref:Tripartite tricarboxylate transporter family receptor n=1 Tax=Variibacter gotjawalensis TaxID=1333996 RepID=A0A0S3Q036_9BRAD|nr:tripartite tricarboxylate transporter substrate binding protein [Variibacter gotjawalensis]RZS49260.1 tripartite-type tricarboxylate transporter receptor subunit TctC [Variibacter gotjawalensis]BAT61522.1 tripartite tricarboxylate transporter family receptor [Variibacter gotjawalensis]